MYFMINLYSFNIAAALDWLDSPEQSQRLQRARKHSQSLVELVNDHSALTLHSPRDPQRRMPTVAFTISGRSIARFTQQLAAGGIVVGSGLQCSPLAHQTLGTAPDGTIRISLGPLSTAAEIDTAIRVILDVLDQGE